MLVTSTEHYLMEILKPLDVYLRGTNGFIAGGCFKDLFLGKEPKDIDICFPSEAAFQQACDVYGRSGYLIASQTSNAFAFCVNGKRVELIQSYFGNMEQLIAGFTFTVTMFGYDGNSCVYHPDFFKHLMFKQLRLGGQPDLCPTSTPVSVMNHLLRYYGYGFKADSETKNSLFSSLSFMSGEQIANCLPYYGGLFE